VQIVVGTKCVGNKTYDFLYRFCSVILSGRVNMTPTFCGLAKVAIFTTNVDAENQCLINHKTVCGALNRHFCKTAVSGSGFFSRICKVHFYKPIALRFLTLVLYRLSKMFLRIANLMDKVMQC